MFSFTIGTCLLLRQSEARFLRSAQTRHNFFFEKISLRSGFNLQQIKTYAGLGSLSLTRNIFSLLKCFSGFPAVLGLMGFILKESTNWQKTNSC